MCSISLVLAASHTQWKNAETVCGDCVFYTDAAAVCVVATPHKKNADSKTTEVQQRSSVNKRHLVSILLRILPYFCVNNNQESFFFKNIISVNICFNTVD